MDDLKQNIRKWNHDILTHMIGITYLMDMQRYPEAERYCEKILNSLSAFSETFQTLLQQKKYPEAHYKLHLLTTEFDNRRPQPVPADDIIKNIVDEVRN